MALDKEKLLAGLENKLLSEHVKDKALDKLIELEIIEKVNHPAYPTLTSYYGKGEGMEFIKGYVKALVKKEGFKIGSALAQFDSNF